MMKNRYILFLVFGFLCLAGFRFGTISIGRDSAVQLKEKISESNPGDDGRRHITHDGTLTVEGTEIFEINDSEYTQNGDIIVKDSAKLRIVNSTLIHNAAANFQYDLNVRDSGKFEIVDSTLSSNGFYVWWRFLNTSSVTVTASFSPGEDIHMWSLGEANVAIYTSSVNIYQTENSTVTLAASPQSKFYPKRVNANGLPASMVSDWGSPMKLAYPVNTPCPEDAIEISSDGVKLYYLFTRDTLSALGGMALFKPNGTYCAVKTTSPVNFDNPAFFELGQGAMAGMSLDGELSFAPDYSKVYFHSNRPDNYGYQNQPLILDPMDIYTAVLTNGVPGAVAHLSSNSINSVYPEGEHAIAPDGIHLYFVSKGRPDALGDNDIYISTFTGGNWTVAERLGAPINTTYSDTQPAFTSDGKTMYFGSDRNFIPGIYRSTMSVSGAWNTPELVIGGGVGIGEPSLTADGQYMYFVYVSVDGGSNIFDCDVYYVKRNP